MSSVSTSPCRSATSSGWRSAVQGDLGYSIQSHRPISEEIAKRIPPTLALMVRGDPHRRPRRHPVRDPLRASPVLEGRLRPDERHDAHLERAHVRAGPGRHLHLRGLVGPPAERRDPDPRQAEHRRSISRPPHAAGDGARAGERRPAAALHAREHARGAQQRVRRDRQGERPGSRTRSSSAMPSGTR